MNNFKPLGLALVAVLAMGIVVASAAQASTVTAESYPATITGAQVGTNELSIGSGARKVTCSTATAHGTLASPGVSTITLAPTYSGCTSTGGLPLTISTNGCVYTLSPTSVTATTGTGLVAIDCPAGQEITIDIYENAAGHASDTEKCEYHLKPQGPLAAGEYHNEGTGSTREISITLKLSIHTVNTVGSALTCGLSAGATGTSALSGTQKLKGEADGGGAHIGVFVS
jgi:hypothetical protein